jgi:ATP-dependent Clp protease ATP-binding subunit ClpA/ATP-dependent Clp protease ATP-binding subunit ClpC
MILHEVRVLESEERCVLPPAVLRGVLEEGAILADQSLPGRALDLLRSLGRGRVGPVHFDELVGVLAQRTGLPSTILDWDDGESREEVLTELGESVMGQPDALEAAADLILRIQTGLTDPKRPFGAFLFTGPTGTGKTQLAKTIASALFGASRLVRFDMGEFSGSDAVPRLMGDRWKPRGRLTEAIRQQPFSVLLLDEIEKAHPSVLYLLLQLLDDGRLTDATGERVDFTRSVVILTSNLGARTRPSLGFKDANDDAGQAREAKRTAQDVDKAVKEFFPPELFNRIEKVVSFNPLSETTARAIADRELAMLLARRGLQERNVFVIPHESAITHMARAAFDSRAGARSVKRYLETHVASLLAEHLASRARPEMELIRLYHEGDAYRIAASALTEDEPLAGDSPLRPLLDASTAQLAARLPDALARIDALRSDGSLAALSDRLQTHLGKATSSAGDADAVYFIDVLRKELDEFREHLETWAEADAIVEEREQLLAIEQYDRGPANEGETQPRVRLLHRRWMRPPLPRHDRREMLAAFADLAFLERAVRSGAPLGGDALASHRVHVELLRVGRAYGGNASLLPTLANFYASLRGEFVSAASWGPNSELCAGSLSKVTQHHATTYVLELAGIDLLTALSGETGCHLRVSPDGESEVVRVQLRPAIEGGPTAAVEKLLADRERYASALERGVHPDVEDPDRLLPVVRRITGDRPTRQPALVQVEDYRVQHAAQGRVLKIEELLLPMTWLHTTWSADGVPS